MIMGKSSTLSIKGQTVSPKQLDCYNKLLPEFSCFRETLWYSNILANTIALINMDVCLKFKYLISRFLFTNQPKLLFSYLKNVLE